jgi:L-asparagine transporter-like permease
MSDFITNFLSVFIFQIITTAILGFLELKVRKSKNTFISVFFELTLIMFPLAFFLWSLKILSQEARVSYFYLTISSLLLLIMYFIFFSKKHPIYGRKRK